VTVATGTGAPVDQTRIALGRPLRIALLHGRGDGSRRAVAHVALASAAEIVASVRASDSRHFVAAAQALREARPEVVVVHADATDEASLAELLEALRLGCGAQQPAPRILALVDARLGEALRLRAYPFEFERFADSPPLVRALRALRGAGSEDVVLRDALIEDGARSLAAMTATRALAVDVSDRSTSLVLAHPDGQIEAAHLVPLGVGEGADHIVARAGLDNVRRWLPWPIDAPALLERVWSRVRWRAEPSLTEAAILFEMALAREAIAHALRDAARAGHDVGAMRSAPAILITGRAASYPRPSQSLLVLVDGLEPMGVTTVFREPDEGRAERIAMVVSITPKRAAKVRLVRAAGRSETRVLPGSFGFMAMGGDVDIAVSGPGVRGHGRSGALGVLIDARGRPLSLPARDGERIPAVSGWHEAVQATTAGGSTS
jgi:hypothetical protein